MSNMYPNTETINPLHGECPHKCKYCYVPKGAKAMGIIDRYTGQPGLYLPAFDKLSLNGIPKMVFVCSMNDLFADAVPRIMIKNILGACRKKPVHTYLLQSKNPQSMIDFVGDFPPNTIAGTTIESNRNPDARCRADAMNAIKKLISRFTPADKKYFPLDVDVFKSMVSIEPVMAFDTVEMAKVIHIANPDYVSIGADSGNNNLEEPSTKDLVSLIRHISYHRIEVRLKKNLDRLLDKDSKLEIDKIHPPVKWQR